MILHQLSAYLWWSPFRSVFEPLARRLLRGTDEIKTGPLRGYKFNGGLAQMLGIYEISIQAAITKNLPRGGVMFDIGANNGFFTLFSSLRVGVDGAIYAFEPFPKNMDDIRQVVSKNHLVNCHLQECAVADFNGEAELYIGDSIATPSISNKGNENAIFLRVPTISLDAFLLSNPKPDLIKLDVEGAELSVLRGAKSLLESNPPPVWIIEIHKPEDESTIYKLLAPGGYQIKKMPKPGNSNDHFPIHIIAYPYEK